MARAKGRLAAAGFERVGPENLRHYRNVRTGEEVSYRRAFREARGQSLESAVRIHGKFTSELRLAERTRFLAREGLLVEAGVASRKDEREIARSTLRQLTKGHYQTTVQRSGKKPERTTAYARVVLSRLEERPTVPTKVPPGTRGEDVEAAIEAERKRINSPTGDKANLLIALGFRDADADYDVGETPPRRR
ncbi:MAG: hypothetical protein L3K23_10425 [Thermoplasmata archaeon]|nr:hypothetical protein [Thermoplasmata archaeon]